MFRESRKTVVVNWCLGYDLLQYHNNKGSKLTMCIEFPDDGLDECRFWRHMSSSHRHVFHNFILALVLEMIYIFLLRFILCSFSYGYKA